MTVREKGGWPWQEVGERTGTQPEQDFIGKAVMPLSTLPQGPWKSCGVRVGRDRHSSKFGMGTGAI